MRKLVVVGSAFLVAVIGAPRGSLAQPAPPPSEPAPLVAAPPVSPAAPPLSPEPAPAGSPRSEALATPRPAARPLSELTAFALSMGGTLGAWGMVALGARDRVRADFPEVWVAGLIGAVLAPSFGHWYRGKILTRGLRVRVAGAALGALAIGRAITCEDGCNETALSVMVFGGFALYIVGTADDIFTAPSEVRKHNQRIEVLGITPAVSSHSAGLALSGRF